MSLPAFTRGHLCLFFVFILVILSRKHTVRSFNGDLYPTIYDENDHIVILDELNFNKTIFCGNYNESCTAFVVEVGDEFLSKSVFSLVHLITINLFHANDFLYCGLVLWFEIPGETFQNFLKFL